MSIFSYEAAKKQFEKVKEKFRQEAISRIKALMKEFDINIQDISEGERVSKTPPPKTRKKPLVKTPVTTKYIFMKDGVGYTGFGRKPAWVNEVVTSGGNLEDYRIDSQHSRGNKKPKKSEGLRRKTGQPITKSKNITASTSTLKASKTPPAPKAKNTTKQTTSKKSNVTTKAQATAPSSKKKQAKKVATKKTATSPIQFPKEGEQKPSE